MCSNIHIHMQICINEYIHTYIHAYVQTQYTHDAYTYTSICTGLLKYACIQVCSHTCTRIFKCYMRIHVQNRKTMYACTCTNQANVCVCAYLYFCLHFCVCVCVYIHICRNIYRYMHMKCIYIYICTDYIHTCVYGARVCVCVREYVRICLSALATRTRLHLLLWLQRFDMSVYVDSSSHGNARVS